MFLYVNNERNIDPLNSNGSPVTTGFSSGSSGNIFFNSWVCESTIGEMDYTFDIATIFTIANTETTQDGCEIAAGLNPADIYDIDSKLVDFFSQEGDYRYVILEENNDEPKRLIIASPNYDYAYYTRTLLSTETFKKNTISIYPNPTTDYLSIVSNLKCYQIQIFDALGKLKMSKELENTESINVENLTQGIYFLLIKDDIGNSSVKKFVKN